MANLFKNPPPESGGKNIFGGDSVGTAISDVDNSLHAQPSGFLDKLKNVGIGFAKGAGRTVVNVAKMATSGPGLFSNMPLKEEIKTSLDEAGTQLEPSNKEQKIGGYIETAGEVLSPLPGAKRAVGESLISRAKGLYESALKLPTTMAPELRKKAIQTGLNEAITISEHGIDKASGLIDDLEGKLGQVISESAQKGNTIKTETLRPFIEEAKQSIGELTDVKYAEKALQDIGNLWEGFVQKYGDNIPVDLAQKIKTNTYSWLRKAYGELSSPVIEANKNLARGLKEGILDVAPLAGGINERLSGLYNFEKGLERAAGRAGNLDVISLGSKVFSGLGGKVGGIAGLVNEIFRPVGKSYTAIKLNRLGEFLASKTDKEIESLRTMSKVLGPVNLINMIQGLGNALKED